jgi:hypothetical protein
MVLCAVVMSVTVIAKPKYNVSDELIDALVQVESSGNSKKVGKLGELGILQIRQCVIDDVNKFVEKRKRYKLSDALDNAKAREICKKYITYWAKKTKCRPCNEHYAKIWNGGPYGWKKTGFKKVAINLRRYWFKVRKELA